MGVKRQPQELSVGDERGVRPRSAENGHGHGASRHAGDNGWSDGAGEIAASVVRHLRASFRGSLNEQDFEDLAQEALIEIHKREVAGDRIRDRSAFAKRVAWQDARDLLQQRRVSPSDPQDRLFRSAEDPAGDPEARLIARAELARAIEAAERLTPEQQAVYRSKFFEQLKPRETCKRLGLARQTYYSRLRSAVSAVNTALETEQFASIERELIGAFVAGTSSAAERRRARRLLAADPHAVALARELRDLHQGVAAALPVPAVDRLADASITDRVAGVFADARDRVTGVAGDQGAEQVATQLSASGAMKAGGAGAGGVMAHLGLAGGAGKIVASCLATGAAATACVAAGVLPTPSLSGFAETSKRQVAEGSVTSESSEAVPAPSVLPSQIGNETTSDTPSEEPAPAEEPPPEPAEVDPVAPTAPPEEQEFGVASAGAPVSSGGSDGSLSAGGGGGDSPVRQEFGGP